MSSNSVCNQTRDQTNRTPASRSSDFEHHSYDYRPNWTPLSPATITNNNKINNDHYHHHHHHHHHHHYKIYYFYIMTIVNFTLFTGFRATHLAIMMLTQLALCPSTGHFWFLWLTLKSHPTGPWWGYCPKAPLGTLCAMMSLPSTEQKSAFH